MNKYKNNYQYIMRHIDIYGEPLQWYIGNDKTYSTIVGGYRTFLVIGAALIFLFYSVYKLFTERECSYLFYDIVFSDIDETNLIYYKDFEIFFFFQTHGNHMMEMDKNIIRAVIKQTKAPDDSSSSSSESEVRNLSSRKKIRNIQINENFNLLKEKLNIDDINKILIDCSIAQFTCLCKKNIFEKNENNNIINSIKTENIINNNNNNKNNNKEILNNDIYDEESIMLFVSLNGIFFYKEDFNEKNDNLIYKLIKTIPLDTLISINKKNNYGNLLNIIFYENKKQICSINIDFESPINSHNFKKTILQMKQIQILNK